MKSTRRSGFTLVEVLIVLVMIGVIAWLFISNFANPIKSGSIQAQANKIAEDMRTVAEAADKMLVEKQRPATDIFGGAAATSLVEAGYLKFNPIPPTNVDPYTFDATTYSIWAKATVADTVVYTGTADIGLCQKINQMFTGAAEEAAVPAAAAATLDLQCFGAGPYRIVKPVYSN